MPKAFSESDLSRPGAQRSLWDSPVVIVWLPVREQIMSSEASVISKATVRVPPVAEVEYSTHKERTSQISFESTVRVLSLSLATVSLISSGLGIARVKSVITSELRMSWVRSAGMIGFDYDLRVDGVRECVGVVCVDFYIGTGFRHVYRMRKFFFIVVAC